MRSATRRTPLLLSLLLGVYASGCSRDEPEPVPAREQAERDEEAELQLELALPEECGRGQEDVLKERVLEAVSRIRIGRARADLGLMDQFERKLTAYEACGDGFARACDAECSAQRAHVHLFRASAIPLLASAATTAVSTSESTMLSEAQKGLAVLDRALERLPRQQGFYQNADATDQSGRGGYNAYLKTYSSLLALRAQLHMTAGDVYYRRASSARARAVSFFIGAVLGDQSANPQGESELTYASTYYEEAYWGLLEARTSLPGDLAASPLFASELSQVDALSEQVGERLRSLRAGKLYIGIDPSGLQSDSGLGSNTLPELFSQLNRQREELAKVEGEVSGTIKDWAAQAQKIAAAENDRAATLTSQAIDLQVYKMQELEEATASLTKPLEQQLAQLGNTQTRFELEAKIEAIMLQLQVTKRSFANDLMSLDLQREQDMLASSLERGRFDLDSVKGLIDRTLTEYNFKMQTEGLQREKADYDQRRSQEELNGRALSEQIRQIDADSDAQRGEIAFLEQEKALARQRQTGIVDQRKAALDFQIQALAAELSWYAQQEGFLNRICAARDELGKHSSEELAKVATCLRGGACGSDSARSLRSIYDGLLAAKGDLNQSAREHVSKAIALIGERIAVARRELQSYEDNAGVRRGLTIAWSAAAAVGELLDGNTIEATLSLIPSITTSLDLGNPFKAIAAGLRGVLELANIGGDEINNGARMADVIKQAEIALEEANARLAQIDVEKTFASLEHNQALAELAVRLLEVDAQSEISRREWAVQRVECEEQGGQRLANVDRVKAEKAALEAQRRAEDGERGALSLVIAQQDSLIGKAQALLRKNEAQKAEVAIRMQQASNAAAHYERSSGAVARQLGEVQSYLGQVLDLERRRQELEQMLLRHVNEISLVRTRASDQQRQFVQSAMQDADKVAFAAIDALKRQLALNQDLARVTDEIGRLEAEARQKLRGYRDELMKLVSLQPVPDAASLIWDLEGMTAQLTRGAGELLDYKRALLASTNYYYNAYRYRYNLLSEFVGRGPIPEDQPYIFTSSDAAQKLAQCSSLGQTPLCRADSLANEARGIPITHATFEFDGRSPLLQEFLRSGRTQFEFSEFARNMSESHNLGDFVLWDDRTMDQTEMRVVGFYLSFPTLDCQLTLIDLRHTGLGYQMTPQGASVTMRGPVQGRPVVLTRSNSQDPDLEVINRVGRFSQDALSIVQLDRRLGGQDGAGTMPFAGYPLRGAFELSTRDPISCRGRVETMKLTVVFAKLVPKSPS